MGCELRFTRCRCARSLHDQPVDGSASGSLTVALFPLLLLCTWMQPRLLEKVDAGVVAAPRRAAITQYAWSDGKAIVS